MFIDDDIPRLESPSPESWSRFLRVHLLSIGLALLVVGIIFFFAANWSGLGFGFRLSVVLVPLVGAGVVGGRLGVQTWGGRAAVTFAALLVGPALALYGQHYQTGADPWQLFFGWALLVVPFALVARFAGLLLVAGALFDGAFALFVKDAVGKEVIFEFFVTSAVAFGLLLVVYDVFRERGVDWFQGRVVPRLLAFATAVFISVPTLDILVWGSRRGGLLQAFTLAFAALVVGTFVWLWLRRWPDLFIVAVGLVLGLAMPTWWFVFFLFGVADNALLLFPIGGLVLAEVGVLSAVLLHLHRSGRFSS